MTFDELYDTFADSVYSYLRFKIRDAHLVQDIFQDTFLSAYKELSRGLIPETPKAWLLSLAHRRMVDRLRKTSSRETVLAPADIPDTHQWTDGILLEDLLARLDESSRTILYSLYVEGLTVRETAALLGIPEGTVKSRCHAAKAKLSRWMKEEDTDGS